MDMRGRIVMAMVCLADALHGQDYFYNADYLEPPVLIEVGLKSSVIAGLTDIGPRRSSNFYFNELNTRSPGYSAGIGLSLLYQRKIGFEICLVNGALSGADSNSAPGSPRKARNLHFKTRFKELSGRLDIHPLSFVQEAGKFSPYIFIGAGINWFDPMARLGQEWINLRDLHTEGQTMANAYGKYSGFISCGVGIYMDVGPRWAFRLELNHTALFTDYFDDISRKFTDPGAFKGLIPEKNYRQLQQLYGLSGQWNGRSVNLPGMIRGDPRKKDAYGNLSFGIYRVINRKRV